MKEKILHLALALLVAFAAWIYVVTVISPESEAVFYNIPVSLINEDVLKDKGLMVTSETSPTVTLKLRGNRSDLNSLKNSDITIIADLAKISDAGEQSLSYIVSFTGDGGSNAFEIISQSSEVVTVTVARWSSKEVDVVLNFTGSVGEAYLDYRDEIILDREKITITGPKSVVDQITQARVDIDLTGLTGTVSDSQRFTLCDDSGEPVDASSIKTNADEVNYTLRIYRVKEILLQVETVYGGGVTQENSTVTLDVETIRVAASEALLENVPDVITVGTVNLAEITENTQLAFPISLTEGVDNLSNIWEVTVDVQVPERITDTVSISAEEIIIVGLRDDMECTVVTRKVEVTVRGREDQIERILADPEACVTLYVDVTEAELGTNQSFKVTVLLNGQFTDVDVSVAENVVVDLTEAQGPFNGGET